MSRTIVGKPQSSSRFATLMPIAPMPMTPTAGLSAISPLPAVITASVVDVCDGLDLDLEARIDELGHLDQGGRRAVLAEVLDAQWIDERAFGDVGHEDGDLHHVTCACAGLAQAGIDGVHGHLELVDRG